MYSFSELRKNLKKDFSLFPKIKLAVLGDSSTQFITQAIKGYGYFYNLDLEIFEADFDQIERQIFDPGSELYAFQPELIIIFHASEKQLKHYYKTPLAQQDQFAAVHLQLVSDLRNEINKNLNSKIIYYNFCELDNRAFGDYGNKIERSFIYQLRKINLGLMELAQQNNNLFIGDLSYLQNQLGRNYVTAPSIYINTDMVFSLDFIPHVAKATIDIIAAIRGKITKCVVLDLDNTLWGGIIGDDGIEGIQIGNLGIGKAFTEFQYWLKSLKERGIILAVCSKNTASIARNAFESHPDMILKMDDFSVFVANWENKVDNIRFIKEQLNIGYDSMVFLDDNPFERNMVKENIPEIQVPELPEDPAYYLEYLYTLNIFETAAYSEEDAKRTAHYQTETLRQENRKSFTDERSFLSALNMISDVKPFNTFNTPRIAQLSQRSNQFNLRTIRYSEQDIERLSSDADYVTFSFTLEDKYGDNGLICTIILHRESNETLFIDTWFMSCRVLKRGMENFVLNTIVDYAKANNYTQVKGQYIPTGKNELVRDHYQKLGFVASDDYWHLPVADYQAMEHFIKRK